MIWLLSRFDPNYAQQLLIWFYVLLMILIILFGGFFAFASGELYGSTSPFE
jgi:hypothetical protein